MLLQSMYRPDWTYAKLEHMRVFSAGENSPQHRSIPCHYNFCIPPYIPLCSISFISQDPVCGSAHCCLAPYWSQKLGKCDFLAYAVISSNHCHCYYHHHHGPHHIFYNVMFALFRHLLEVEQLIFMQMNKIRGCCCEEKPLLSWKVVFWFKFRASFIF